MERVSKNIVKGGLITDLNEIVRLANERKSVVITFGTRQILYTKPAAFILNWPLSVVLRFKLYYAIKSEL